MLGIKRMDHVCMVVPKLDERLPMLTELFGLKVLGRWENPQAGYNGATLEVPGSNTQWELLEPSGEDSFLVRFLRDRGPGLHHVTFEVEDVDQAAQAIRDFGIEPFGGVQRSHGWAETYIHPKDSGGVLFQFFAEEGPHDHEHEHEAPK